MAKKMTVDGNTAVSHVAYAFSEVAAIYPITPSSPMAEVADDWAAHDRKNLFGQTVRIAEMQSEAGAAGAVHGSLKAGALTTTFTASQGLLLMIPNMYKIAGELLPCVFHVSARALAYHALSIFGDHSDVMACRQTGFAMLASNSVQEAEDMALVAHVATLKSSVPFLHFFDGFRTSHEIQKIDEIAYEDMAKLLPAEKVAEFRARALNPDHPTLGGTAQNPDIYFQGREAGNKYYNAVPAIVEEVMDEVGKITGRPHKPFDYVGAPDAEYVIVAMGSGCDVATEAINKLNEMGEKVGLVSVHLYRPFCTKRFVDAIPATCKRIAVLDRTKESGSLGEPLYLDVCTALIEEGRKIEVVGGRYGLGSKEFTPTHVKAVFDNLKLDAPKNHFTVGIVDDVTNTSLPTGEIFNAAPAGAISCKFYGLGSDGTVGANKNSIKIIGDHTDKFVQAYFQYDSKKTGGVTISHLRFGDKLIKSPYYINKADFVACHVPSYITKHFPIVRDVKPGGVFLVNCQWDFAELEHHLDAASKRYIANNNIQLYMINAIDLAKKIGMGKRTNTILQSAFFSLAKVMPEAEAIQYMKDAALHSYLKKGQDVVDMNYAAIDAGATAYVKVEVPESWKTAEDHTETVEETGRPKTVKMVRSILDPIDKMDGDSLPVSTFVDHADGTFELGASAYEKRGIAVSVPKWDAEKCVQCNQCAFVCPHATIRPFALTEAEAAAAPAQTKLADIKAGKGKGEYKFAMAVSPLDCMGCGVCISQCAVHAIEMVPMESQAEQQEVFDYMVEKVSDKPEMFVADNVKFSQFAQPYLEFSGSCAGCAETSYARLVTQLFGDHMMISNATGCSSIWGGPAATSPYTVNKEGHGPAWANSLFEDNAEHGLGMYLGQKKIRDDLKAKVEALIAVPYCAEAIKTAAQAWLETYDDGNANQKPAKELVKALEENTNTIDETIELFASSPDYAEMLEGAKAAKAAGAKWCTCEACTLASEILEKKDYLNKKSCWIFGGDGWAFDIGFGGVDHVLASGEDVNIFVFNTEVYSNTGGQASKASNIGQVAQFAAAGKEIKSKSLAEIAMTYGYVYVAQIAMGANKVQTLKAIAEAEAHKGPSIIIAYSPCEMHSIKGGMENCQKEMEKAVKCGYWNLFRFNPDAEKPFTLDSKEPAGGYQEFLMNEARYSRLTREFPARADRLFKESEDNAKARYEHLMKLKALYE